MCVCVLNKLAENIITVNALLTPPPPSLYPCHSSPYVVEMCVQKNCFHCSFFPYLRFKDITFLVKNGNIKKLERNTTMSNIIIVCTLIYIAYVRRHTRTMFCTFSYKKNYETRGYLREKKLLIKKHTLDLFATKHMQIKFSRRCLSCRDYFTLFGIF